MSCPICEKRPPKRFCPAKGERICAVCCGRERETTIDCPVGCSHLIAAHRYELEHREAINAGELPYRDVQFSVDFLYERWPLLSGIGSVIVTFASRHRQVYDLDVCSVLERLAETYRTLVTGIYYERLPELPLQQALYRDVMSFLDHFRNQAGFAASNDSDVFKLLVFLLRMNKAETNGRPRSRAFLELLRARFPLSAAQEPEPLAPRIITP